jgi:hypothetical protein
MLNHVVRLDKGSDKSSWNLLLEGVLKLINGKTKRPEKVK